MLKVEERTWLSLQDLTSPSFGLDSCLSLSTPVALEKPISDCSPVFLPTVYDDSDYLIFLPKVIIVRIEGVIQGPMEMAQKVECLLSEHDDLSSNPHYPQACIVPVCRE